MTEWIAKNGNQFGGDTRKIIVCGESAGGNLAAAVACMAKDNNGPKLAAQILLYPVITSTINEKTYAECPDRYFMNAEAMKFFWYLMYLPNPLVDTNHYASLDKRETLTGLPPALVITAEYDPLRPEGKSYAKRLQEAKIPVISKCYPKLIHAFLYVPLYNEEQKVAWTKEIREKLIEMNVL